MRPDITLLSSQDIFPSLLCFSILLFIAFLLRRKYENSPIKRYFIPAFVLQMLGCLAFFLIYQYHFGRGDIFKYFHASQLVYDILWTDFSTGWELLISSPENYSTQAKLIADQSYTYLYVPELRQVVRIGTFVSLLTLNTSLATGLILAFFSFSACWKLFRTFHDQFPHLHLEIACATLFVPSVVFWGAAGLTKDTICMAALGFLVWSFYQIFIKRNISLHQLASLVISSYFLVTIKIYLFLLLASSLLIWVMYFLYKAYWSQKSVLFKSLLFSIVLGLSIFIPGQYGSSTKVYETDNILLSIKRIQNYNRHHTERTKGSGYTLGDYDTNLLSFSKIIPGAINATLFRPYLWEANKPILWISAFDSLFTLLFTLYVLWQVRFNFFRYLFQEPALLFCLSFALMVAFTIGVTAFNFGTLTRYKIFCLPFYFLSLILLLNQSRPSNEGTNDVGYKRTK